MKPLSVFLTCSLFLFWSEYGYGTIRVADNNQNAPGGTLVYSTLQAALDTAAPGDTIHVMPSIQSYGNVTIPSVSRVTILGIGNPVKDLPLASSVGQIGISSDCSDILISGLIFRDIVLRGAGIFRNVTIEKCYFSGFNLGAFGDNYIDGLILRNNIAAGDLLYTGGARNVFICNNFFMQISITARNNALIQNNIFFSLSPTTSYGRYSWEGFEGCIVANNIFYRMSPATPNHKRTVFTNNIAVATGNDTLPPRGDGSNTGMGNQVLSLGDPLFVRAPTSAQDLEFFNFAQRVDFRLKDGSPGDNAGTDGTDIGIYGGATPFTPNFTSLPIIQRMNTSGVINQGSDLKVDLTIKAN